jgi:hypothetical protein
MESRDPVGDCQAQAHAARLAIARIGHPIERTEDVR